MPSKLGRKKGQRNQLVRNLTTSLILHGQMVTTLQKGKSVIPAVERIFTLAKQDSLASRRHVARLVYDKKATVKVFEVALPNLKDISSGFVSLLRLEPRKGDGAEMALVKINPAIFQTKKETKPAKAKESK
jgi:large subunit ribosomal protein L17